jgi:hypothetical protein
MRVAKRRPLVNSGEDHNGDGMARVARRGPLRWRPSQRWDQARPRKLAADAVGGNGAVGHADA